MLRSGARVAQGPERKMGCTESTTGVRAQMLSHRTSPASSDVGLLTRAHESMVGRNGGPTKEGPLSCRAVTRARASGLLGGRDSPTRLRRVRQRLRAPFQAEMSQTSIWLEESRCAFHEWSKEPRMNMSNLWLWEITPQKGEAVRNCCSGQISSPGAAF